MKFKYIEIPNLPRLAWCAKLGPNREIIEVIHGSGVEVFDDWFFEGAWDGPFDGPGFAEASTCFGTGGLINNNSVEFVSPTHHMQGIVTIKTKRDILVSNSIPFILTQASDKPDVKHLKYYEYLHANMVKGFVKKPLPMIMKNGSRVYVHMYSNIKFGEVDFQKSIKRNVDPFIGYIDYRDRLIEMLIRTRDNAMDSRRGKQIYEPLTMVSRGYDSVACSALAAKAGCKQAVAMVPSDPDDRDNEDDGTPIAESLGLSIEKYDMHAWYQRTDVPETQFVATAWGGIPVRIVEMENRLRGTMLFKGDIGDRVWEIDTEGLQENYRIPIHENTFPVMSGISQWEFRLRVGYLGIYPATYAILHSNKFAELSKSKEMSSWSIGGDYDRPIPRRIAEETGVPRELFGQKKMATIHEYPGKTLSINGRDDYKKFLEEEGINNKYPLVRKAQIPHFFHWGINRTMERYLIDST